MVWGPNYIKKQLEENTPKKPFSKAKSVAKRLIHTKSIRKDSSDVTTDFDDLLALRMKRAKYRERDSQIFMIVIVLGIILFLYVMITNL